MRFILALAFLVAFGPHDAVGQQTADERLVNLRGEVRHIQSELDRLSRDVDTLRDRSIYGGSLAMLFGAFCALWAQNTRRNAWLWFFMGAIFSVITVLVLLAKNSNDPPSFPGAAPGRVD